MLYVVNIPVLVRYPFDKHQRERRVYNGNITPQMTSVVYISEHGPDKGK
jgi:hypothetical protein